MQIAKLHSSADIEGEGDGVRGYIRPDDVEDVQEVVEEAEQRPDDPKELFDRYDV